MKRPFVAMLALVLVLATLALPTRDIAAATPASGTLTPTSGTLTYTGGPYLIPNVSAQATLVCTPGTCDDFALTVDAPALFAAANFVRVETSWPNKTADFDLYIYDAAGRLVASSPTGADPEIAYFDAVPGQYVVRLVTFLPLGDTFTTKISFAAKPAAPPPAATPQWYHDHTSPAAMANAAGEPSIGVNWATDHAFFQSGTRTYRVSFDDSTTPATATWLDKSARLTKCDVQTGLDPIGFVDHETSRVFSSELLFNQVFNSLTCYSQDEGETWSPTEGGGVGQGNDHQTIGGGPYHGSSLATTAYPHAVYYCSQAIVAAFCSRSDDGGVVFHPAVQIYGQECSGLHGHVKVAPDGTVYVPNRNCGGHQALVRSLDNGVTWQQVPVPSSLPSKTDPSVAISSGGVLYFGYRNVDGHARVAVSLDQGATWSYDTDIGAPANIQNAVFPAAVAGDNDRGAIAFIGSTTSGDPNDHAFAGTWQLYVAHTYDGGRSWTTTTVDTPNDPVQRGCLLLGGGDDPCRNLLDFIGADIDSTGRVLVGFADGCIADCVTTTNPTDSTPGFRTDKGVIARQTTGKTLFSRFDPPAPDLTVTNITAAQSRPKVVTLSATVANIGTAAATNVVVRFFDGSVKIADATANVAAAGTATASVTWTGATNGDHSIVVTADPDNLIIEKDETNNTAKRLITITGNKVSNGSFEQSSGTSPTGWTPSGGTTYSTSSSYAVDGKAAVSVLADAVTGQSGEWVSGIIEVTAGTVYDLAMTVTAVSAPTAAPSLRVSLLGPTGTVTSAITALAAPAGGTTAATQLIGQVTIPAGVSQIRLVLAGFAPADLRPTGTVWFDDLWLWQP